MTTRSVLQPWVEKLPLMQQTVLLTAIRGPDGLPKYGPVKMLLRWYRRCFLMSSLNQCILTSPLDNRGGSFMGPSLNSGLDGLEPHEQAQFSAVMEWEGPMNEIVGEYLKVLDSIPQHFHLHFMHGAEILGYKHPHDNIRGWWYEVYVRLVRNMHLYPEPESVMDERLSDSRERWLKHNDAATVA